MYTHTIAIARCLLTEGRLSDVDRMISPLLPAQKNMQPSSNEELLLRCLLAQARLFGGTSPDQVLTLFTTESNTHAATPVKHLESAVATLSIGLTLVFPVSQTQDLPRALHLFGLAQDAFKTLRRSDYLHWTYIGQAIALYGLREHKEAQVKLKKAGALLEAMEDQVAHHWLRCIEEAFSSQTPVKFECLVQPDDHRPSAKNETYDTGKGNKVYVSEQMLSLLNECQLASEGTAPILILGERGSGKETISRLIHECQPRERGNFEVIDCAAIPDQWDATTVLEAAKDATSGSPRTLFLNHIELLTSEQQLTLLAYFKQTDENNPNDVLDGFSTTRIMSASSARLPELVSTGQFDAGLYHRLKICTLVIPPLRAHKQDIPVLALHFLRRLRPAGVSHVAITENALDAFLRYDWPGNIRQLKNEIERILVHIRFEPLPTIDFQSLSKAIRKKKKPAAMLIDQEVSPEYPLDEILSDTERTLIERVLGENQGQVSSAASALGLTRQGLYKKLKRLGISLSK